jgi:hypothetical protein
MWNIWSFSDLFCEQPDDLSRPRIWFEAHPQPHEAVLDFSNEDGWKRLLKMNANECECGDI